MAKRRDPSKPPETQRSYNSAVKHVATLEADIGVPKGTLRALAGLSNHWEFPRSGFQSLRPNCRELALARKEWVTHNVLVLETRPPDLRLAALDGVQHSRRYTGPMELHLPVELEGKLVAAASRRGVSVEVLAREALERAVDYDDWFLREVETGLAQVDAGQTLTHDAVGARIAKKLAEHDAGR